ncbi:MAG: triple tyrosine motif-containing protein [Flavobacteriales bacterium]
MLFFHSLKVFKSFLPLSFFFLSFVATSRGQSFPPRITVFSDEEYGAHTQITCSQGLPKGRVAFGTSNELLIYDGADFSKVPVGDEKVVTCMALDEKGRLFVGGRSLMGVVLPDSSGDLRFRSLRPLLPDSIDKRMGTVWNCFIEEEGEGHCLFNARSHLFRFTGDSMEVIHPEKRVSWAFSLPSGIHFKEKGGDLLRLDQNEGIPLPDPGTFFSEHDVLEIVPLEKGEFLMLTRKEGLYRYTPEEGSVEPFLEDQEKAAPDLRKAYTMTRMEPSKNPYKASYAVGTLHNGIHLFDERGRRVQHITRKDGLPTDFIWDLRTDRKGNLWSSTNKGIALLHTGSSFTFLPEGGLFTGTIWDVSRTTKGSLFLATSNGAWNWDEQEHSFRRLPGTEGQCWDLLPLQGKDDGEKLLIAGGNNGLLLAERHEAAASGFTIDTLFGQNAYAFAPFSTSYGDELDIDCIVGGRDGIYLLGLYPENGWKRLLSIKEIPGDVNSLACRVQGSEKDSLRIWASLPSKGMLAIDIEKGSFDHRKTLYTSSDGLPKGRKEVVGTGKGSKVLFTTKNGLYHWEEGSFGPYCLNGLERYCKGYPVIGLHKGSDGDLWIRTLRRYRVHHLKMGNGKIQGIDSLPFSELRYSGYNEIHAEEGRAWIGGEDGILCYHERVDKDYQAPWWATLQSVRVGKDRSLFGGHHSVLVQDRDSSYKGVMITEYRKEQSERSIPTLPYEQNGLMFEYAAFQPDHPREMKYSYRLKGFDAEWSEWNERDEKEYTNLPEGSYTFEVKGRDIYGTESRPARFRFKILPPWYRADWAYTMYGLTALFFIWGIAQLNARRVEAQKKRLERIVYERTREIQEQKEELEQKNEALEDANKTISHQKEEVESAHIELSEAHREITDSIEYAQKIQHALLQNEEYVSDHLPKHFILFKPQSQVSGDFYWIREKNGFLYMAAIDCTGHGVPGAFMSMLGVSLLNEIMAGEELLTPGEVLTRLRERVVRELSGNDPEGGAKDGMDAAIVRIPVPNNQNPNEGGSRQSGVGAQGEGFNPNLEGTDNDAYSQGEGFSSRDHDENAESTVPIEFAGAQNPLYVVREGIGQDPEGLGDLSGLRSDRLKPFKKSPHGIEIKGDSMPVGYDEHAEGDFTTICLHIRKGDLLYIFSDGYADQFGGPKGKKFRYGPFKELLVSLREKPMVEQKQELDRTFEEWKRESEQEQIDDVLVMGIRI